MERQRKERKVGREEKMFQLCVYLCACAPEWGSLLSRREKEKKNMFLTSPVWAHAVGSAGDKRLGCWYPDVPFVMTPGAEPGLGQFRIWDHFISHDMNTHLICSLDLLWVCVLYSYA